MIPEDGTDSVRVLMVLFVQRKKGCTRKTGLDARYEGRAVPANGTLGIQG